ncbi:NAD-binding protein [Roseomonas gilardii]|uniref:NAD-binding protein n=1 Tax=Roseomonas gilardii TaxID=257708 RepID=UPI003002CF2C
MLHVSCSTVSVALTERRAAAGKLSVIAAGTAEALDRLAPLFGAIGAKTLRMGERPAMAAATKLAANFGIAAVIELVSEQMRIAGSQGVPAARFAEFLTETDFGSRMMGVYAPMIAAGRFELAGFPMTLERKDVGLALEAAGEAEVPVARLLAERMDAIIRADGGERDWAALGQAPKGG